MVTPFNDLARVLKVIASPTRLEILHALRTPKLLNEIRVKPSLTRESENPERVLARQSVRHHLDVLLDAGLLYRAELETGERSAFALNHERVFALVDQMRQVAKLRPTATTTGDSATLDLGDEDEVKLPDPPRVLVAYGRDDRVSFPLTRDPAIPTVVGRGGTCGIQLDYDPYLSTRHCAFWPTRSGFEVEDLGSRNGTLLNWRRVPQGGRRALRSGDLVTVGRSVIVFQE